MNCKCKVSPMGILSFTEINELMDIGVIEGAKRESVNATSLNVTLGDTFLYEQHNPDSVRGIHFTAVEFAKRQSPAFTELHGGVVMAPGSFALASIVEKVNLPADIACHVMLRSSAARMGIEHSLAGWGDPGYSGNLTLELKNVLRYHGIRLRGGDQIVQLIFHRVYPVPADRTYDMTGGKYSGDTGPQAIKVEHGDS